MKKKLLKTLKEINKVIKQDTMPSLQKIGDIIVKAVK